MKVLLTGATGFVGQEVARALSREGHALRLLMRRKTSPTATRLALDLGAELVEGDVLDPLSLAPAAQGIDAVVHLVGIISEVGRCTFENIHARGTRDLVQSARTAGVPRFVHMSALGTRPGAPSRYHQTKWAAEQTVRHSSLQFTIFRPSLIYGPGDHFVNLFASIARFSPVVPLIGRKDGRFQPVSVHAVATAFARSLNVPESIGLEFDLCGHEIFTLRQMLDQILSVQGRRRLLLPIPSAMARLQAMLLELIYPRFFRQAPPLNRDQLLMLQEDNVGDPLPADRLFDLKQGTFREGIESYLAPRGK